MHVIDLELSQDVEPTYLWAIFQNFIETFKGPWGLRDALIEYLQDVEHLKDVELLRTICRAYTG